MASTECCSTRLDLPAPRVRDRSSGSHFARNWPVAPSNVALSCIPRRAAMTRQGVVGIFVGLASAAAPAVAVAQASFEPLGRLRPGDGSNAWGVSANGAVVVGESSITGFDYRAFRTTGTGALQDLGSLPGLAPTARALDVSADGSVVVGDSGFGPDVNYTRAFRWTAAGGMVDLGHPSGRATDAAVA